MNDFIRVITSSDAVTRDRSLFSLAAGMSTGALLAACDELEAFRTTADNLFERVRATHFLFAVHRFILCAAPDVPMAGAIPPDGYDDLLARRYEQAILRFRATLARSGPNITLFSALAKAYHRLTFQTLANQVRRSVRACAGNQWMFRVGHADDHPLRLHPRLLERSADSLLYPILCESTPVRLDLSHSGWSDIFFLGMDYPEGARVINLSVDLGIYGRDPESRPPIETYLRVIPEPVIRLTSIDLRATKDITTLYDLFNFGNDYLSLLKAGLIASGVVPPSFEGTGQSLAHVLERIIGPGMGLELVTNVNDIPKGSRLAVSTNLLASIISLCMRATRQIAGLEGEMSEVERRLVASRAILGEWLGGSGGGWQDSGGIWPGIKVIEGMRAQAGDPEFGISAGCLLPRHRLLGAGEVHPEMAERLEQSLVLLHGGLAQNVGPILEMVTEKYLLRSEAEWQARQEMRAIFDGMLDALREGDVRTLAGHTMRNWSGPLQAIIPWVTNAFTAALITQTQARLREDFWGFLMLGGMSGGGMGLFVAPQRTAAFRDELLTMLQQAKGQYERALPFAIDPLLYTFRINHRGSTAVVQRGDAAFLPTGYYMLHLPLLVRQSPELISSLRRAEVDGVTARCTRLEETRALLRTVVSNLFRVSQPASLTERLAWDEEAATIKAENGFDPIQHERIRHDLRSGRIGLTHNRLPIDTEVCDVQDSDVTLLAQYTPSGAGERALRDGRVAVMTLAAGVGSRWTHGAGVIKALHPFAQFAGQHRSFLEVHLAKTRHAARAYAAPIPHLIATSFLTHAPIAQALAETGAFGYEGPVYLSPGRSIGQRLIPMVRDLVFLWEEMPQEQLDEQKQKVRDDTRAALCDWATGAGEGNDYEDNVPIQRFNPPGHWYEVPNLFSNGTLARLLTEHPQVETLMLHNIDTLGADLDPAVLDHHLTSRAVLTYEVIPRRIGDQGGGLARVNGRVRLLEGLAQPREQDELNLRYYNSLTTWIQVDPLLALFGLTRDEVISQSPRVIEAVRAMAHRVPTYVTIKTVKRRWGHGQEDVYPVAQFEKLWGDMTSLSDLSCSFLVVPIHRGQQLKDPDELDAWANDGSREAIAARCDFMSAVSVRG